MLFHMYKKLFSIIFLFIIRLPKNTKHNGLYRGGKRIARGVKMTVRLQT